MVSGPDEVGMSRLEKLDKMCLCRTRWKQLTEDGLGGQWLAGMNGSAEHRVRVRLSDRSDPMGWDGI
jgi:uncharacterized protein (DUF2237 family)